MSLRPTVTAEQQRVRERFGLRQRGPVLERSALDIEGAIVRRREMLAEKFPAGGISRGSLRRAAIEAVQRFHRQRSLERITTAPQPIQQSAVRPAPRILPRPQKLPGTLIKGTRPQDDPIFSLPKNVIGGPDVSLHKGLLESIGTGFRTGIQGRIASIFNPQPRQIVAAAPVLAAGAAAAGRVLPAIGRVLTGRTVAAASAGAAAASLLSGGGGACPSGWHPAKDGSGRCVRNRRMNFGNARAARRSVRRLKGARKLLKDIEKMMPSKTTRRRASPAGHAAHLHHTGA